jgi:hypothetical protein
MMIKAHLKWEETMEYEDYIRYLNELGSIDFFAYEDPKQEVDTRNDHTNRNISEIHGELISDGEGLHDDNEEEEDKEEDKEDEDELYSNLAPTPTKLDMAPKRKRTLDNLAGRSRKRTRRLTALLSTTTILRRNKEAPILVGEKEYPADISDDCSSDLDEEDEDEVIINRE